MNPPDIPVEPARKSLMDRVSIVWVVPLTALLIAMGVAWQTYSDRGPLIEIAFAEASGITAGQTELHFRDITVGMVEDVTFTEGLEKVLARVRLDQEVAPFVDDDAQFWVVEPEVTTRGISGLDTVLSGVFIEGVWDADPSGLQREFEGLASAPLARIGQDGTQIQFRTNGETSLLGDTPIVYRGVEVGYVGTTRITADGSAAVGDAIVFAPYDELITTATRFWDTSGFTFSLGPNGAEIDFDSIASLVAGGITFETIVSGGDPIENGANFEVFADEAAAQNSVFNASDGETLFLTVVFDQNVAGLTKDAPVELGGLQIGIVNSLTGVVDVSRFGDRRVRLLATLSIDPGSLGLPGDEGTEETLAFLSTRVAAGMRARLASASLLTGGLKIEFAMMNDPVPDTLDLDAEPFPRFPSVSSEISDISATAEGVFNRINNLPIEDLLASAIRLMDNAGRLIASDALTETPGQINGLLADMREIVGSDEIQQLPGQVGRLMEEVQAATTDLRGILTTLEEANAAERLLAAVDAAAVAAESVGTATAELPALITRLERVGAQVEALPLDALLREVTGLIASADQILGTEAARALPQGVAQTLEELRQVLNDFRTQEAATRLLAAVDAAGVAARQIGTATEDVPGLVSQIEALAAKANGLPLEDLLTQATALVSSTDALVGSDGTKALPGELAAALAELNTLLTDLNEAEAATRLLTAVDAAADAAASVSTSVEGVPALIAQIDALAATANGLPLDALVEELTSLTRSADAVVATEGAQALPGALASAVDQVRAVL
ncbi:MAG: MlaD family protein, partial [Pseudomonadota bacterium]